MRGRGHRRGDGQLHGAVDAGAFPGPASPTCRMPPAVRWPAVRPVRWSRWPSSRCIREGFETAVFLLAAFQSALSPVQAAIGVDPRRRGRGRPRLPDLPRRDEAQPVPVLPDHRRGAGAGRRRSGDEHAACRLRGRLADRRAADLAGPVRHRPAGIGAGIAAHRHARHPLQPAGGRGRRLPAVRGADAAGGAVAAAADAVQAECSAGSWSAPRRQRLVVAGAARALGPAAPAAVTGPGPVRPAGHQPGGTDPASGLRSAAPRSPPMVSPLARGRHGRPTSWPSGAGATCPAPAR